MKERINVITAGPSAGKTSTLRELSARGYRTLPEAARLLLDQRISEGDDPDKVRHEPDFHEQVEHHDHRIETHLQDIDDVVFLDRSLADNIAYRRHFNSPDNPDLWTTCTDRYDNIFILERLDFQDDAVRAESGDDEAQTLHDELRTVYQELGYNPIDVPLMPVDQRADYIEDHITKPDPIH